MTLVTDEWLSAARSKNLSSTDEPISHVGALPSVPTPRSGVVQTALPSVGRSRYHYPAFTVGQCSLGFGSALGRDTKRTDVCQTPDATYQRQGARPVARCRSPTQHAFSYLHPPMTPRCSLARQSKAVRTRYPRHVGVTRLTADLCTANTVTAPISVAYLLLTHRVTCSCCWDLRTGYRHDRIASSQHAARIRTPDPLAARAALSMSQTVPPCIGIRK